MTRLLLASYLFSTSIINITTEGVIRKVAQNSWIRRLNQRRRKLNCSRQLILRRTRPDFDNSSLRYQTLLHFTLFAIVKLHFYKLMNVVCVISRNAVILLSWNIFSEYKIMDGFFGVSVRSSIRRGC